MLLDFVEVTFEFNLNLNEATFAAGHSLGEYTALSCLGSLKFSEGLKILKIRGKSMQNSVPVGEGGMIAVIGAKIEELDKVVKGSGQSVSGNIGSFQVDGAVEGLNQDSQYNVFIEDEKLVFFRDVNGVIEIAFDSGSNVYLQTIVEGYDGVILIGDGDDSQIIINQSN